MAKEPKNNQVNKYLHLTSLGFQMMVVIFVFVWIGKWADERYETPKAYFTALGSLVGLAASLYLVLKQLKDIK
jgi:uncharacterized membrane protein